MWTEGRWPCKDGGRDCSNARTSQELWATRQASREAEGRFCPRASEKEPACRHLGFWLPASQTAREYIFVILSMELVVLCYSGSRKQICCCCCSVARLCPTLQPHGLQHARLPCPVLSSRVCSNSCPLSCWHYKYNTSLQGQDLSILIVLSSA